MKREDFIKVAEETLDSLPEEFRSRIHNVAILVEDFPANQRPPKLGQHSRCVPDHRILRLVRYSEPSVGAGKVSLGVGLERRIVPSKIARLLNQTTKVTVALSN